MLQYLSAAAFSPFGRLLDSQRTSFSHKRDLWAVEPVQYTSCRAAVKLGPGENMAVLVLLQPSGETVSFYLDKPVELQPSSTFAVLPLDDRCSILWEADAPMIPMAQPASLVHPALTPSIDLQRLYTFFDQRQPPGFLFAGERHPPYELVFVCQGILHNLVGGQDYVLQANEALVIPPDQWHMQYGEADLPVRFVTVTFSCWQPLPQCLLLQVLPEQIAAAEQMRSLLRTLQNPGAYGSDLLLSGVQLLLVQYACGLPQGRERQRPDSLRNENLILDRALEYVAGHTHERISVEQLAKHCSVSAPYLSLLFQRHLHIAPGAYMLRARLAESCLLLRNGTGTVSQIADQLCFSSPQHFSSAFKQQYGMSPSMYIKKYEDKKEHRGQV